MMNAYYAKTRGMEQRDVLENPSQATETLVDEILVETAHRWEPTEADLDLLCEAVNRRAKRLFVTRNGRELNWL